MPNNFVLLIREIEFLIADSTQLKETGPCFTILHRYWVPGTVCSPGEEVALIELGFGLSLPLPLTARLLVDYLGHYRLPQSAAQIEAGMRSNPFYANHAYNVKTSSRQTRRFARSEIRVYIERIRKALEPVLEKAGINLDPAEVLVAESTVGNEVSYKLKASVEVIHSRW